MLQNAFIISHNFAEIQSTMWSVQGMLVVMDKAMWRFSCLCHCRTQLLDIGSMISSVTNEGRCLSISRGCLAPTASTIDLVTLYQLSLLKLWLETPNRFYFNKGLLNIAQRIRKSQLFFFNQALRRIATQSVLRMEFFIIFIKNVRYKCFKTVART